jgi:hypothetical protein
MQSNTMRLLRYRGVAGSTGTNATGARSICLNLLSPQ